MRSYDKLAGMFPTDRGNRCSKPNKNINKETKVYMPVRVISAVEKQVLSNSHYEIIYTPFEKIPVIVVDNFPMLGKLAALRFLEWVQDNPEGVISLPTGKTPEYFIKQVKYFLENWDDSKVQTELEHIGINPAIKPKMKNLYFVQIDEFYPVSPSQTNSFNYYVRNFYIEGFGLDPAKCLLINPLQIGLLKGETLKDYWPDNIVDLSLRYRNAKGNLEIRQKELLARVDQWCMEYEGKIRQLGGIGFFLGGIGPDGHIGFNIKGSDHNSTTRLCPINYETQAAMASDLGGIEVARNRHVITIGLSTITCNPDCAAIIMAAGSAKANVVADAIQSNTSVDVPASALRCLANARFYITEGAAKSLQQRNLTRIKSKSKLTTEDIEEIIISLAVNKNKCVLDLDKNDLESDSFGHELLRHNSIEVKNDVYQSIISKINNGMRVLENKIFLHTEPHHDDVMLGCLPVLVRHFRKASNIHNFITLTSGFTSVTNEFIIVRLEQLLKYLHNPKFEKLQRDGYFAPDNIINRNRDVWQYLDGVAAEDLEQKVEGQSRRFLRDLIEIYNTDDLNKFESIIRNLIDLLRNQYPGQKNTFEVQKLKGMCREWESECLWGYYGWKCDSVRHLRLGFYTGDIFTEEPTHNRDILPVLREIERTKPDIITVALDPEASGPDTHYKVLQAISEAIRLYQLNTGRTDMEIWGYRNVWYRFEPWEANMYIPVSLNMFSVMRQAFENCFISQKTASFPSYEYDGPFSVLAQKIQVQQYQRIKTCLGRQWFSNNDSPLTRATRGLVFLKSMTADELYHTCRRLKKQIEGD
jgi:glucosamine-6-phosphate deaminase